ncbi:MAG: hypothetical protein ABJF10_16410 [Chthoniobacter sp.]|uniref:hypothetical protein n=1 Tax=Chthoniobacter sp. TaxID=2510640 RepID=UPI0032A23D10
MKRAPLSAILIVVIALVGCGRPPPTALATPEPEMKKGHPVVHVPPVETRPFEDGYNAGFEYGKKHAVPHGALATEEDAKRVAREQAAGQPDRWERGFAEGYADGVRNVVTGQK